jgi:acid phosphatase family membrane protein YuiD
VLSPEPEAQYQINPPHKTINNESSTFTVRYIFEVIVQHMVDHIPISNRASRLDYLLLQLRENQPLKEMMNKFDKKDLAVIAEHKKFI